jgi:iron complex outermembrane receptor protein
VENYFNQSISFWRKRKTYQSWNGIDAETVITDRTFNSAGIFTDESGNTRFYDNETDNYQQDHFQLHWSEKYQKTGIRILLFSIQRKGYMKTTRKT